MKVIVYTPPDGEVTVEGHDLRFQLRGDKDMLVLWDAENPSIDVAIFTSWCWVKRVDDS